MLPLAPGNAPIVNWGGAPSFCVLCSRIAIARATLALLMPVELVLLVPPNGLIRMSLCRSPPNKRCSLFRFSTTPLLRLSFLPCSSDNQHLEEKEKTIDEQEPVFLIRSFLISTVARADYVFLFVYDLASCYHSLSFPLCGFFFVLLFYSLFLVLFCLS